MRSYIVLLIIVFVLPLFTCRDKGTDPPQPQPGKRDYVWTIDTISYPGSLQTLLVSIWGSSSKDVWAGGFNERGWGELYHYDGTHWRVVIHGYRKIDIGQIFGFAQNDVYLAGAYPTINPAPPPYFIDSSVILHFDGSYWKEIQFVPPRRGLQGIWGSSLTNIFAVGLFGTLFHYNGTQWTKLSADTNIWFSKVGGNENEIYMLGYTPNDYTPDHIYREYLFKWSDTNFVLQDSMVFTPGVAAKFGSGKFFGIAGKIYSVGWGGLFIKNDSGWQNLISDGTSFGGIFGTRKEHIFACGSRKSLYHFDGNDWKKIEIPGDPLEPLIDVWCTEDEVFILRDDGNRSYVIHGK